MRGPRCLSVDQVIDRFDVEDGPEPDDWQYKKKAMRGAQLAKGHARPARLIEAATSGGQDRLLIVNQTPNSNFLCYPEYTMISSVKTNPGGYLAKMNPAGTNTLRQEKKTVAEPGAPRCVVCNFKEDFSNQRPVYIVYMGESVMSWSDCDLPSVGDSG
eukprot:g35358.t1